MMEKLFHERLRDDASMGEQTFSAKELESFADEIERYYIPRPRFEDGEPVQFGDAVDGLHSVDTISFYEDRNISLNSVDDEIFLGVGKTLKRPTCCAVKGRC